MKFTRGLPAFTLITSTAANPFSRRDLGGVFGGLLGPGEHGVVTIPPGSSTSRQEHGLSATASTVYADGEPTKVHEITGSRVTAILSSTLNEMVTSSENSWPSTWSSSSTSVISWPTPSTRYAQDASHMSPGEETEWKVIGITVFCITVIVAIMLATFFSDTLVKLFKDICLCGNRKRNGEEDLVPDWQRRSWEYKLADEEGHRYPTVSSSLQSMAEKNQSKMESLGMVALPPASYMPELDPHPLDPLLRRPSCKQLN